MRAAAAIGEPRDSVQPVDDGLVIDLREPRSSERAIPFFAGLDGLRGAAVIAVLCFHGGFAWATGGYLGVSTFFTLSGFLITSLLLAEAHSERRIDLKGFYGRRLRRLLPASLAAIALAAIYAAAAGSDAQQRNIGGDVTAALADVANWRFILQRVSYGDMFAGPSPLLHFWSLAIEEQFYLVFPLIIVGAAVGRRRAPMGRHRGASVRSRRVIGIVAGLMVASLAVTLFVGYTHDRIYFGTETRGFELLAGALLAAVFARRRLLDRPWSGRATPAVVGAGAAAAAVCVALWVTATQDSDWIYRGGLAGYALASCAVIAATVAGRGPLHATLTTRPLRRVGELSYGLYLFHWPVFLFLDRARTGLSIWPLFLLRIAITAALAVISARIIEQPIRQKRLTIAGRGPATGRLLGIGAAVIAVVLLAGAWTVTRNAAPPLIDFAALDRSVANAETPSSSPSPSSAEDLRPARVAVFGDSTAATVAGGLAMTNSEQQLVTEVRGKAKLGCPLGRGGQIRSRSEHLQAKVSADCSDWADQFASEIDGHDPDIAMVLYGPWDVLDRKLPHDNTWRGFGDPTYDAFMRSEMLTAVDTLSSRGALVVWFTTPPVRDDQARTDRFNELIRELPAERPGKVVTLDLAGWVASVGDSKELRPDHLHITPDAAAGMSREWLIPQLRWLWVSWVAQDPHRSVLDPSIDTTLDRSDDLTKPD